MTCECRFNLYSMNLSGLFVCYDKEVYVMPCTEAADFLKKLDSTQNARKYIMQEIWVTHKVDYSVEDKEYSYTSQLQETPAKASAKIELFIKNPNFLPNCHKKTPEIREEQFLNDSSQMR